MNFMAVVRAALQAAILFGAGVIIPVAGQIATFFTPVPIILAAVRRGMREALAAIALAAVLIAGLAGAQAGAILVFGFGLMALGAAAGMRRGMKAEQAVLLGGLLPVAAGAVPLIYFAMHAPGGVLAPAEQYLRESIQEAVKLYRGAGLTDMAEAVSAVSDAFIYYFVRVLPGITVSLSLAQAASCYGIARALLLRRPENAPPMPAQPAFASWHAPDKWVWGLIVSLGCIAVPQEAVKFTGINLGIVYFLVYAAQGMAVVDFVLKRAGLSAPVRSFVHAVIVALPSVMFLPPLGVVDIWADFRKVRAQERKPTP